MLILQGAMTGVFVARKDLLLFALFWDLMLIPVFLLMLGWGVRARHARTARRLALLDLQRRRRLDAAARDGRVRRRQRFDRRHRQAPRRAASLGYLWGPWIFAGFAFAFLIKTPVWPLHTWMPDTYTELPPPVVAVGQRPSSRRPDSTGSSRSACRS